MTFRESVCHWLSGVAPDLGTGPGERLRAGVVRPHLQYQFPNFIQPFAADVTLAAAPLQVSGASWLVSWLVVLLESAEVA